MKPLRYRWLGDELAVCRLEPTAAVPAWLPASGFTSVTRTADELSVVCAASAVPRTIKCERGWAALKVCGPLPFDGVGILRRFAEPLADAGIPIIALGTFDTDYVLVQWSHRETADSALVAQGLAEVTEED